MFCKNILIDKKIYDERGMNNLRKCQIILRHIIIGGAVPLDDVKLFPIVVLGNCRVPG